MAGERRQAASPAYAAIFAPIGDEGRALLVERRIAEAIRSGLLTDGERLPSEVELAQLLGVAPVTAREALVALREQGLLTTVRGRNGGSFVTAPSGADLVSSRLASMSRLELRDRATHYVVVLTGCAELAAERVDPGEVDYLRSIVPSEERTGPPAGDGGPGEQADPGTDIPETTVPGTEVGAWRRAETELWLAVSALTQSARLTREVIRLEADFGALMRLPLEDAVHRAGTRERMSRLADALASSDPATARAVTRTQLNEALERLADLHAAVR